MLLIGQLAKGSKLRLLHLALQREKIKLFCKCSCFLPSETHSEKEQASEVLPSDKVRTEMNGMLPAREGHVQTLPDSQLPLY